MNFVVDVTDQALDSLPQDLPFAVLDRLLDELDAKLGGDPVAHCHRVEHPTGYSTVNACFGGFRVERRAYVFTAFFHYSIDETAIKVWRIKLTAE